MKDYNCNIKECLDSVGVTTEEYETEATTQQPTAENTSVKSESDTDLVFLGLVFIFVVIILILGSLGGSGGFYDPDRMY